MATNNRAEPRDDEVPSLPRAGNAAIQDRIAAFAMLDAMGDATQAQRCMRLSLIGFANSEIAAMLQTTPATVSQNLYEARKRAAGKKPRRKSSTAEDA